MPLVRIPQNPALFEIYITPYTKYLNENLGLVCILTDIHTADSHPFQPLSSLQGKDSNTVCSAVHQFFIKISE